MVKLKKIEYRAKQKFIYFSNYTKSWY